MARITINPLCEERKRKGLDTMPRETETPATVRAAAEEAGRQAFEQATATAEPQPTPPPAWWESPKGKESTK